MKRKITDLRVEVVRYTAKEGLCTGTNVMYNLDGHPASARLPSVATAAEAQRWLEART